MSESSIQLLDSRRNEGIQIVICFVEVNNNNQPEGISKNSL